MFVGQNGAADDGQVRVGPYRVMGEDADELQQAFEGGPLDLHGNVFSGQYDTVLVVVNIGRILHEPVLVVQLQGDQADGLSGGMIQAAGVARILGAEQASGIGVLSLIEGRGDGLGILFRLGQVDGDIQLPVAGLRGPLAVLADPVGPYVIRVFAEGVKIIRSRGRTLFLIKSIEAADDLRGTGGQAAHDAGVEEIPAGDAIIDPAPRSGVIEQDRQDVLQFHLFGVIHGHPGKEISAGLDAQYVKDTVGCK